MPKKIQVPKIEYVYVEDKAALEAAFDYLFDLVLEEHMAEQNTVNSDGKPVQLTLFD
jgi:hypothetical protein